MRVVAGPSGPRTLQQAGRDPHLEALSRLAEQASKPRGTPQTCTLILRSPSSAPARALVKMTEVLAEAGIQAKAILAKFEPERDLDELVSALRTLAPATECGSLIRWARNPRLWDAHEQVRYGQDLCWWGDPLRRAANKRNPLVLFETAPEAATRATRSFRAVWRASVPMPARLQAFEGAKRQGPEPLAESTHASREPFLEVWPLVRH